jgi:DNA processing protein
VQAAERSGASITAHFALHQGKQVLAVPGSIFDPLSAGCHALIKEGATPILSPQDLLKELGETSLVQTTITQALSADRKHDLPIEKRKAAARDDAMPHLPDNPTVTDLILFHCKNALSAEDLLEHVPLEFDELQNYLFDLQLEGRIEQNAVGLWQVSE